MFNTPGGVEPRSVRSRAQHLRRKLEAARSYLEDDPDCDSTDALSKAINAKKYCTVVEKSSVLNNFFPTRLAPVRTGCAHRDSRNARVARETSIAQYQFSTAENSTGLRNNAASPKFGILNTTELAQHRSGIRDKDQNRRDIVFLSRKAEGVSTQTESGKDVGDEFESSIGVKSASGRRKCPSQQEKFTPSDPRITHLEVRKNSPP
ncbi:hypothetical protein B0H14DRAFT_2616269 [Mycena olivaceomarginata]|nr:hypothetical protein B0H14DRAFT_2616269 [Mycena olivaceomarginata]